MPATAKPVAQNAAIVMCSPCCSAARLNIAATGSMLIALPSTQSNPAGAFIHPLAPDDKHAGRDTAHAHDDPACPVRPRMNAIPAVEKNPESDSFEKKSRAFPCERQPADRPCAFQETWARAAQARTRAPCPRQAPVAKKIATPLDQGFGEVQINQVLWF